jgi:hypothetical protein
MRMRTQCGERGFGANPSHAVQTLKASRLTQRTSLWWHKMKVWTGILADRSTTSVAAEELRVVLVDFQGIDD